MTDSSSEADPVVIIDRDNPAGYYWDVSTITTKVVYEYGRNRPFAYAEVTVKKAYFNSKDLYWASAPSTPIDASGNVVLPNVVLGETPIHIEAYGASYDMIIDNKDEADDSITFKCYSKSYKLRSSIYLSSLVELIPYSADTSKVAFARDPANPIGTPAIANNRYIIPYKVDDTSTITIVAIKQNDAYKVDYIEGTGTAIFKFIAINALGFESENCVVDAGYTYNFNDAVQNSYTMSEMQIIKGSEVIAGEDTVRLRVGYLCWDLIKALGYLSNRWPFFYDRAYFVDYNDSLFCMKFEQMRLDYGVDDEGANLSYTQKEGETPVALDIYHIVDSVDQGTTYVQSSQTVNSENHSEVVTISDATKDIAGKEIVFPYPETYDSNVFSNATRDALTKKLAFERVVTYFKPQDCVQFTISEMQSSKDYVEPTYTVISKDDLPDSTKQGDVGLVTDGVMRTYYQFTSTGWTLYQYATYNNSRNSRFSVYSVIDELYDAQNNITMYNAPLSFVQLSWPECVTMFTFGNPEFIDSAYQLAQQEQTATNSIVEGTADLSISDKQAAKIVVGNQTLSQLDDDRTDFTGLIMEKNRASELYRLSGYNNGVLQSYFDSQGRILSGDTAMKNGKIVSGVMIDENGITIAGGELQIYDTEGNLQSSVNSDGEIVAGGGSVRLDSYGLYTYNKSGTVQCYIGTDGTLVAGGGAIKINRKGLYTYNSNTVQCYIGTDGMIVAGGGAIVLNKEGMKTFNGNYESGADLQCSIGTDGRIFTSNETVVLDSNGITIGTSETSSDKCLKFQFSSAINPSEGNRVYLRPTVGPIFVSPYLRALELTSEGDAEIWFTSDISTTYLNGNFIVGSGNYLVATTDYNLPNAYVSKNGTEFTWYITYGTPDTTIIGGFQGDVFIECGGYVDDSSTGNTSVTFPVKMKRVYGGSCTTWRDTQSDDGNDYVNNITTSGMKCKHDEDGGFIWRAWGVISKGLK